MTASQKDESPIDALSTEGLEALLESDDLSPVEVSSSDCTGDMWTVDDAIKKLGITKRTVLRKIKNGELTGFKVPGVYGQEWRLYPIVGTGDLSPVTSGPGDRQLVTSDSVDMIDELRSQIIGLKSENSALQKDLQAANWRNGYLEAQTELKNEQIKLLTESKHNEQQSFFARFSNWFFGRR